MPHRDLGDPAIPSTMPHRDTSEPQRALSCSLGDAAILSATPRGACGLRARPPRVPGTGERAPRGLQFHPFLRPSHTDSAPPGGLPPSSPPTFHPSSRFPRPAACVWGISRLSVPQELPEAVEAQTPMAVWSLPPGVSFGGCGFCPPFGPFWTHLRTI